MQVKLNLGLNRISLPFFDNLRSISVKSQKWASGISLNKMYQNYKNIQIFYALFDTDYVNNNIKHFYFIFYFQKQGILLKIIL